MTQQAKGLRQFVVARQQTRVEQVVVRQTWRLVAPRRLRAKPRHSRLPAGAQAESDWMVVRQVSRFVERRHLRVEVGHWPPAATHPEQRDSLDLVVVVQLLPQPERLCRC